jgi:OPT family oligopeptide transporter
MVSYGLTSFATQGKMIVRAFKRFNGDGAPEGDADPELARPVEVPRAWFVIGGIVSALAVVALAWGYFGIPPLLAALAVVLSFFLTLVGARATGETSVTPMGPLGKITQLTYGVIMPQNALANLATASITAGATGSCADLLNDLKVGYLLGANPRRQYIAQLFGVVTGTLATTLGYFILVPDATRLTGVDGSTPQFPAPAAHQWKAVADVMTHGIGSLHPMARQGIAWGIALGIVFALAEMIARPEWKKWIPSATGVGFGLMMPFSTPLSFLVGALLAELATRLNRERTERYAIPIASGVIAGESIFGILVTALNNFVL